MNDSIITSVEPNQVVSFLKKEVQYKAVWQKIFYQRIIHQAAKARNITVTPEEIQAEAEQIRRQKHLEKASDTLAWLSEQMISAEDWEAGISDRLLAQKLSQDLFAQEIEKFFVQHQPDFEQILLYQIIVPYPQVAQEIFYQIEEQEISFYEAAHLYDLDAQRRRHCGYEGKVYRSNLAPEIAAVVFGARPGEIVGPLKSDQGYHIFKAEEIYSAELTSEVYQQISQRLFKEWLNKELDYLLYHSR